MRQLLQKSPILKAMLPSIAALIFATSAHADSGGIQTPQSENFWSVLQKIGQTNKTTNLEQASITPQKADGQDPPGNVQSQPQSGVTQGPQTMNVQSPTPPTSEQKADAGQQVQKKSQMQQLFTQCIDHGHPGMPNPGDKLFRCVPMHDYQIPSGVVPPNFMTATGSPPVTGATENSDVKAAMMTGYNAKRLGEQLNTVNFASSRAELQGHAQQAGEATNSAGASQFASNFSVIQTSLINVANENAGAGYAPGSIKTLPQAIGMVQQVYKGVFLPMALLLLLPGAVATQVMCVVHRGMNFNDSEEVSSPLTGILRAMVAVFLIPATQLIVSYSIDVGNSMTGEVVNAMNTQNVVSWANNIVNPNPDQNAQQKRDAGLAQTSVSAMQDLGFGTISMLASDALMILCQYQIVMACYLFLMGPIAACFFAWPARVGKLFKPVFANWLDALFNLVLWRFWWCVILLCISTRLAWLQDIGEPINGPWERLVFISFQVMLAYVPFMALEFKPGQMVDQLMEKAKSSSGKQGAGGKALTQQNKNINQKGLA